jgi:site-specific recombinase XerD
MDLQADIKWIQQEIEHIQDPDLIEAFKRMLKFNKKTQQKALELYNRDIELSERDIENGNTYSQDEIEEMRLQWKRSL